MDNEKEGPTSENKTHVVVGRTGVMVVSEEWFIEAEKAMTSLMHCFSFVKNRVVSTSKKEIDYLFHHHH